MFLLQFYSYKQVYDYITTEILFVNLLDIDKLTFNKKMLTYIKTNLVMLRKKLIKEVTIRGKNLLRQDASITFLPAGKPGWYLRTLTHGTVPIDHRIARHREGRIQLHCGDTTINIWEHIGILRFFGIDGVVVIAHNKWPPFLGGVRGYYPAFLKDGVLEEENSVLPTIKPLRHDEHQSLNGILACTEISSADSLELQVQAKWGDLPWYKANLAMDVISSKEWYEICDSKPQGWPKGRSPLLSLAIRLLKQWTDHGNIAWIKDFKNPEDVAYAWGLHRVQDIFGCLSLCSHKALPAMKFRSYCAGHKEDLKVLKKCF